MKKKKVTAPLTYDPGKGRPKEHLAYLNWQEMQALKRLNGNNQERGPKGLPSFPPADAIGSSSKASSSKSSSKSTGARGPTGPQGQARSSPAAGGKAGSVSRSVGAGKASNVGASRSSSEARSATSAKSSAAKGTGARGPTGPKGEERASPAKSQAPKTKASESGVRSLNVGPMGTRVDVKTGGTQIRGAVKNVSRGVPAAVPKAPARTVGPAGPSGAPSYTGMYNPATGRYDAISSQAVNRAGKTDYGTVLPSGTSSMWGGPPQTVNRVGKGDMEQVVNRIGKTDIPSSRMSGTATSWGGPTVDVVDRAGKSDLPAATPSFGDTISNYASSVRDAVYGGISSIGSMFPSQPVQYGPRDVQRAIESMRYQAPTADLMTSMSPYTTGDIAMRNALTNAPGLMTEQYDRAAAEQGLLSALEAAKAGRSIPAAKIPDRLPASVAATPSPFSWEGVRPYDVRVTAPPASGIDLRAPSPTRELNIQPMGMAAEPEERVISVEDMPEETPFGLTGKDARKAAKEARIPASVYNQPGFTDDVDQLGIGVTAPDTFSATDMAKLHARAYGGAYLTPSERTQAAVTKGILRGGQTVLNATVPLSGSAAKGVGKLTGAEPVETFLGRPSYEKSYLRDLARAENIRYGRDPLGRESYTTADGQTVSAPVTGGIGAGRSSDERGLSGGISSLPSATPTTPSTEAPSTSGTRPYIYYQWDLGMNVPSQSDPNYTQYQKYLSERNARRVALGMA